MTTIILEANRGTETWEDLLETLGDDAPEEMLTEDSVEIECDLAYEVRPASRSVGEYGGVIPESVTYKGHDMERFFSSDELYDAAADAEQSYADEAADARYERSRDRD